MNITLPPGSGTGIDWNGLRDTIKAAIPADAYLERSPKAGHGMYICPFCGSGTGEHGTGALQVNKDGTAYCHVCGKAYDVIDVYQKTQGIQDYHEALQALAERHAIPIPLVTLKNASSCHSDAKSELTPTADKAEPQTAAQTQPAPTPSFRQRKSRTSPTITPKVRRDWQTRPPSPIWQAGASAWRPHGRQVSGMTRRLIRPMPLEVLARCCTLARVSSSRRHKIIT